MKIRFSLFAVFLLALIFAGRAAAQSAGTLVHFRNHAIPVLVQVNAHGHVTRIQPSIRLQPQLRKVLRHNIQHMITGPAMHNGHAVSSQFVMQLALKATKRADGNYRVQFVYVSKMQVPLGPMYWSWSGNDDHLALVPLMNFDGALPAARVEAPLHTSGLESASQRYSGLRSSGGSAPHSSTQSWRITSVSVSSESVASASNKH